MNKKVVIEAAAAAIGLGAGAATAYFAKSPEVGPAIGGAVYLASKALGYFDPGVGITVDSVSQQDLHDAMKAVSDAQKQDYGSLANDLTLVLNDARAVIAAAQAPEAAAVAPSLPPSPLPTATLPTAIPLAS